METEKNKVLAKTLYLVATPIGNLADMSDRAKKVLREVDFIAAEDTRNSRKLLDCFDIHKDLVSYHEHNKKSSGQRIVERLLGGESCALVTDAGMPAVSDPGEDIVRLCADAGITVSVIPGPCAAVSALSVSGLCTSTFAFEGFLSANKGQRREHLHAIRRERRTMIFYEAPHKLRATLADLCGVFGDTRRIALARELTKLNEEVIRTTLGAAVQLYTEQEPRGEYVLILEGAQEAGVDDVSEDVLALLSLSPEEHLHFYTSQGLSRMDAIKAVAKDRHVPKAEIYKQFCSDT